MVRVRAHRRKGTQGVRTHERSSAYKVIMDETGGEDTLVLKKNGKEIYRITAEELLFNLTGYRTSENGWFHTFDDFGAYQEMEIHDDRDRLIKKLDITREYAKWVNAGAKEREEEEEKETHTTKKCLNCGHGVTYHSERSFSLPRGYVHAIPTPNYPKGQTISIECKICGCRKPKGK